jgi:hypothetical protein
MAEEVGDNVSVMLIEGSGVKVGGIGACEASQYDWTTCSFDCRAQVEVRGHVVTMQNISHTFKIPEPFGLLLEMVSNVRVRGGFFCRTVEWLLG